MLLYSDISVNLLSFEEIRVSFQESQSLISYFYFKNLFLQLTPIFFGRTLRCIHRSEIAILV
jgi:hypothetical protein